MGKDTLHDTVGIGYQDEMESVLEDPDVNAVACRAERRSSIRSGSTKWPQIGSPETGFLLNGRINLTVP
jgi:hypothetical protein